jgi:uncharacterized protein (TIGR03790 family)
MNPAVPGLFAPGGRTTVSAFGWQAKVSARVWAALRAVVGLGLALVCALASRAADSAAARVVLLASRDDPDSLRVAHHYAEARGVPHDNIIALPLSLSETISWREFVATLWTPLQEELLHRGWLDAIPMELTDAVGRRKVAAHRHRMTALVVCRGVPLRINHDGGLYTELRPLTNHAQYRTNAGCVDAELSLLALPNYPINAFVLNPLFQNENPAAPERGQIVCVARLDGPSVDDALGLVDRALAAERAGLLGRAYIDIANRDAEGDRWLEVAGQQLADLGYDVAVDRESPTMPAGARCDAAAFYFGWYSGQIDGPWALPGFRFPPGAIALHIHSYSAATLRSASSGWVGPLIARGVTATMGNVFEPYLRLTHRPDVLTRALARGATLGEAALFALPVLSWQAVFIGDPLYRPFAVALEEQLKNLSPTGPALAGYAVLRKMETLAGLGRRDEAEALARAALREMPRLEVGVALAELRRDALDREGAALALGFAVLVKSLRPDEWGLARRAAQLLAECERAARAVEVWRLVFAQPLPAELRIPWLREAAAAARAAKDDTQAGAWEKEAEAADKG